MKIQDPSIMATIQFENYFMGKKLRYGYGFLRNRALLKSRKGPMRSRRGLMESFRHGGA
jgi:hypothetical protein